MTQPPWDDDPALVADLREALAPREALPPDFAAAARAAFAWRTVDEELFLAELSFDSSAPHGALAIRAGTAAGARLLVFDGGGYRIDAEIDDDGDAVGQVSPASGGTVSCQTPDGTFAEAPIDEAGCFSVRTPAAGAVRLRLRAGGRPVSTDWINLGRRR
ncbi:hypothetical protein ACFQFC_06355 [Amorphoplanes digitatis]|uniref:Uncharacterized protein n=1 Tax=Actinoplanes digitatis TaxID=1868 RepID=A0A7W7HZT4_9ACTN|nr:hypothetical protein [Actinoplanes digitatis]MBB4763817.1 hypothetical protein [Actinoplanes digitatis]GID95703.1 hypothetical protein Adi01nite_51150 [Actinoplanes digitatis]